MSIHKYFNKNVDEQSPSPVPNVIPPSSVLNTQSNIDSSPNFNEQAENTMPETFDLSAHPSDPGKRPRITEYHANIREQVRRNYYLKGACQPNLKTFPQTNFGGKMRRFKRLWFEEYSWLEYSISKDSCFCLCCFLFKNECGEQGGGNTFVIEGFKDWKNKCKLRTHEETINSAHNQALSKSRDLLNQNQHIETVFDKMTDGAKKEYRTRLNASINCIRWIMKQGLAFRGHDESVESNNQGNFLELLKFLADNNEEIRRVALKNASKNLKLTAPHIQKDIVSACAFVTTKAIIDELGDGYFSVFLDDSRDVSIKEQMAVVIRYVDKKGCVLERILGIKHVECTSAVSLKNALVNLLNLHGLNLSMVRGQGYDGASNMRGKFNGLKALILKENKTAYYIHCFAHQLQLALVGVAKNHIRISELYVLITHVVNVAGGSCKRKDILREQEALRVIEALENEEISSGQGLNQESTLIRPCDTRWSSHYGTILSLIKLFASVIHVLEVVKKDGMNPLQRGEASRLTKEMRTFDFVFDLHLMKSVLGITHDLCNALQRRDQDIVNAMILVDVSKKRLQAMRDDGWSSLVEETSNFCAKHSIEVPDMDDIFVGGKRKRRRAEEMTNAHRYRVEVFYTVIDVQLRELNGRFNEVNTELLLCVACLNPSNSFEAFNLEKLVRLSEFYPKDFQGVEILALPDQLENFILDMRSNIDTLNIKGLGGLAQKMVETKRNRAYPLVYRLIRLVLVLPVATGTVERVFSAMDFVKPKRRNRMADEWMNDNLVVYIEREVFNSVTNEEIIQRFQGMKKRRGQL